MAGGMTLTGMDVLEKRFYQHIAVTEKRIVDLRKQIATALTEALIQNIPVWSGRTMRSINWSEGSPAPMETHPDRGNTSPEGFHKHHQEFGSTSRMSLGSEPQFSAASAVARASVASADFSLNKRAVVTVNSTAGARVEAGTAPDGAGRNKGIVSALAVAQIKSMFSGVVS